MKKKLKRCPFCGSEARIEETEGCDYVVSCSGCGCYIHDDMKWSEENYDAVKNVTEKWNNRPLESTLMAKLDCKRLDDSIKRKKVIAAIAAFLWCDDNGIGAQRLHPEQIEHFAYKMYETSYQFHHRVNTLECIIFDALKINTEPKTMRPKGGE